MYGFVGVAAPNDRFLRSLSLIFVSIWTCPGKYCPIAKICTLWAERGLTASPGIAVRMVRPPLRARFGHSFGQVTHNVSQKSSQTSWSFMLNVRLGFVAAFVSEHRTVFIGFFGLCSAMWIRLLFLVGDVLDDRGLPWYYGYISCFMTDGPSKLPCVSSVRSPAVEHWHSSR